MVGGSGLVFRRLPRIDRVAGTLAYGGMSMDWTMMLALVVATVLVVYLTAALLKPEMFS
jgi:K+-transporting ATPase KdpF subunit